MVLDGLCAIIVPVRYLSAHLRFQLEPFAELWVGNVCLRSRKRNEANIFPTKKINVNK